MAESKVIPNNCVSEIKIPNIEESAEGGDYSPVLNLYATFNNDKGISVWNPVSGKVVAEFRGFGECFDEITCDDTLFVPGSNHIAVSVTDSHNGGIIHILNLGKIKSNSADSEDNDDEDEDDSSDDSSEDSDSSDNSTEDSTADIEITNKDLPMLTYPVAIALSPGGNLLVADALNGGTGVYEIFIDWDNLKVLKSRKIIPGNEEAETGIMLLCCSPDFKVTTFTYHPPCLSSAKVCLNSEGEVEIQEQDKITYYVLNGEEKHIDADGITGLVHDGENLIIANEGEIVLLESTTEGSNAHLIASGYMPNSGDESVDECDSESDDDDEVVAFVDESDSETEVPVNTPGSARTRAGRLSIPNLRYLDWLA
ncbi:hypothetical protein ACROYT_G006160 [Oculina patagonica]